MNIRPSSWGTWVLGLIGSVVAHVAILALLIFTNQPEPVTEQPMPTSELEVQAYQLDRTKAREQQPERQQAEANTPDGTALDAGAIPQSRANPAPLLAETLQADQSVPQTATQLAHAALPLPQADPATVAVAQATPLADSVQQADPAATTLETVSQATQRIEAAQASPAVLAQSAVPAVATVQQAALAPVTLATAQPAIATVQTSLPKFAVVKVALPATAPVQSAEPQTAALSVVVPDVAATPSAEPRASALPQAITQPSTVPPSTPETRVALSEQIDAPQVQPATPNAQKLKAALAFSGGDGDVDPVSIAAFQSFMQPGDIAASGDQLRDGVAGLLAQVPCSRMQVAFDPDTATLKVNGHIPDDDLRAPVLAALREQMGANITVSDNILILPRPQCGALSGIAGVGLPQSTDQITNPLVIGDDAHARVFSFTQGDLLSLDMTAPDYDAYIYLDYFDADGMVLHLEPNEYAPLRQANAQTVQEIGAKTIEEDGLKLVISPPYGQEIAVAFAASAPLYDGLRPIQEPAEAYLAWLKTRVEQARRDNADFKGEWIYFFVSTAER